MRKFSRYLVALLFQFVFVSFLILVTLRFQILNPDFLLTSFRNADIYKQSVLVLKEYLGGTVEAELQAAGLDELPTEQQKMLEDEILKITSEIDESEVQDLVETNIIRFFGFINNERGDFLLYFPIHNWGLPSLITSQEPLSMLSENTPFEQVMSVENAANTKQQLINVQENVLIFKKVWYVPLFLVILLLIVHFLLSKPPQRIKPTAWLLIISGVYTALMCGVLYVASNELVKRISLHGDISLVLISMVIPHLLLSIISLWAKIAGGLLTIGIIILIVQLIISKSNEKKQRIQENPTIRQPVASTTPPPQQNSPVSVQEVKQNS